MGTTKQSLGVLPSFNAPSPKTSRGPMSMFAGVVPKISGSRWCGSPIASRSCRTSRHGSPSAVWEMNTFPQGVRRSKSRIYFPSLALVGTDAA